MLADDVMKMINLYADLDTTIAGNEASMNESIESDVKKMKKSVVLIPSILDDNAIINVIITELNKKANMIKESYAKQIK